MHEPSKSGGPAAARTRRGPPSGECLLFPGGAAGVCRIASAAPPCLRGCANIQEMARTPSQLMPDELATLRGLWDFYPDGVLMNAGRNHAKLAALVDDGYIEATECALGMIYRIAPKHADGLARVARSNALAAERN